MSHLSFKLFAIRTPYTKILSGVDLENNRILFEEYTNHVNKGKWEVRLDIPSTNETLYGMSSLSFPNEYVVLSALTTESETPLVNPDDEDTLRVFHSSRDALRWMDKYFAMVEERKANVSQNVVGKS